MVTVTPTGAFFFYILLNDMTVTKNPNTTNVQPQDVVLIQSPRPAVRLTGKAKAIALQASAQLQQHGNEFTLDEFRQLVLMPMVEIGTALFLRQARKGGLL